MPYLTWLPIMQIKAFSLSILQVVRPLFAADNPGQTPLCTPSLHKQQIQPPMQMNCSKLFILFCLVFLFLLITFICPLPVVDGPTSPKVLARGHNLP